ncbi:leucyl aminopeptidase [Rummeliibacillus stabekisii]|uniref:leucyl aminopeptidase n=1 Tax=Rummeliibacillus stabekisii TaxID=241244 RepID=UPI00203E18B9|nr:leucyl aminopeptidase [Rummeliibacillus stabekisii]MCM3317101.1 leucyl aminopeptidase [Rummeliibacillus stabekisii]
MQITQEIKSFATVDSDVLIVGVSKNQENVEKWAEFVQFFGEPMEEWVKSGDIQTDTKSITKIPVFTKEAKVKRILFIGLGNRKSLSKETLRAGFGLAGKALHKMKASKISLWVDSFTTDEILPEEVSNLAAEGIVMGSYTVENYKTTSNEQDNTIEQISFITDAEPEKVFAGYHKGEVYAAAVNEARTLINRPGNLLTSTKLADYAVELAKEYNLEVEILDKAQLEELGMGAILAVNKGSKEEPRMITLKYQATEQWEDVIGLVGKGVTFDTGGYSLKTKTGIVGMKGDMGGAAAVLGAMRIVGEMRPNKNVIGVIGSTDNMISGDAFKPDDVITTFSGKTVEILNTDAEGRLVLADAVAYAKQQGANTLIDLATLTGGVITALGYDKTGALTNDEAFYRSFVEAANKTDEFVWQLPLTENDKKRIRKSDVADLNNSPGGDGHMIFGGGFIGEFVGDTPWIHLDIAGTSDAMNAYDFGPKGGTGVMVRTLATFIDQLANSTEE